MLRGTGSDKLLVTLESKDDRERIQENRGVTGNVVSNNEAVPTVSPELCTNDFGYYCLYVFYTTSACSKRKLM
jgi:hypothetical protein